MNIEIRPFRRKHLELIIPREYERELAAATKRDWSFDFAKGAGFTLFADGVAVGAGGIAPVWNGVGEAWLFLSPWFHSHVKTTYRIIREQFGKLLAEGRFVRVQCPIRFDMPRNKRLVRHLDFQPEGLMHRWGPEGADYSMYAIVAQEGDICRLRHC